MPEIRRSKSTHIRWLDGRRNWLSIANTTKYLIDSGIVLDGVQHLFAWLRTIKKLAKTRLQLNKISGKDDNTSGGIAVENRRS